MSQIINKVKSFELNVFVIIVYHIIYNLSYVDDSVIFLQAGYISPPDVVRTLFNGLK